MRKLNEEILISPSDLVAFLDCKYNSKLSILERIENKPTFPQEEPGDESKLISKTGKDNELRFLNKLKEDSKKCL